MRRTGSTRSTATPSWLPASHWSPCPGTPPVRRASSSRPPKRYLLAGDCIDLYENWAGDAEADHIPSGVFTDLVAYEQTMRRIEKLDCEVIPSHDALVVERRVFT